MGAHRVSINSRSEEGGEEKSSSSATREGEVIEHLLGNGLKVFIKEVHAAPVATCHIWYKVGARNERPGITGISHWVEHMLFKGTPSFPKEELKRTIERNGGQWDGFTQPDCTVYFENLPSQKIEVALRLEADRMRNSAFDRDEVEAERTVIFAEREGAENSPEFLLREEVRSSAYKAHPYRWGIIGWRADLQSITRDDLYDYYKAHYAPNNATLVLVGNFPAEDILEKVYENFEEIPAGKPVPNPTTVEPEQLGERRVIVRKEGNIAYVYMAYHTPAIGDADIYLLDVLGMVLSSGRSSRLYRALVGKELATYASFDVGKSKDPGLAWLKAGVRAGVRPAKVENALLAEIEKIQSEPISDSELSRAINQAEARFVYNQDSVWRQSYALGNYESLISYKYLDTYLPNIRKVSKQAIQNAAQRYLTADNRTVGFLLPISPRKTRKTPESPEPLRNGPLYYRSQFAEHEDANRSFPRTRRSETGKYVQPADSLDRPDRFVFGSAEPGSERSLDPRSFGIRGLHPPKPPEHGFGGAPSSEFLFSHSANRERQVLENGLVVIAQENHILPIVSILGRVKAGGVYDTSELAGCADFVANMLQRGTRTRTRQQIAEDIEAVGASIDIGSTMETSSFRVRLLTRDLDRILRVLADIVRNPVFPEEEIEKHRSQVRSWLKSEDDDPAKVANRELRALIYPEEHPYHRRVQGYERAVRRFTRGQLMQFYHRYYRPDATMIAVVGDVNAEEAIGKIKEAFGDWRAEGEMVSFVFPSVEMGEPARKIIPMMDKSQVAVFLGHKGICRTHTDFYAVDVMNCILGGPTGFGRLFSQIRDAQGLAYNVRSSFEASLGEGPFIVRAGVNPKNVPRVIQSILDEIRNLKQSGITGSELTQAEEMIAGTFPFSMETNSGIANVLLDAELYGLGLDYPEKHKRIHRSVTKEQAEEAAQKYLHPDKCSLVAVGPYSEQSS